MPADSSASLRVKGLREFNKACKQAAVDAADQKELMHELGMIVVRAADPPVVTGALNNSIKAGRGKTKAVVRAGGARVPYAPVIHYGWPGHNIEANPFLNDALTRKTSEIVETLNQGIGTVLRKNRLK